MHKKKRKYIFVAGASGFIGKRLLSTLNSKADIDIRILSRHCHHVYETVICDLQSEVMSDDAFDEVDTIFHLAGFAHDMRDTSKVEHLYRAVNVDATARLAELAVKTGVKSFVFVSSVKAGGVDENDLETKPEGAYGQSKREAELKLLEIGRQSEMHISIVRPSLVFGPRMKGNLALMQSGIKQGWFPPLPKNGNRRSMIHVDDLVQALLLVADDSRANGEIFIATDGIPHSSREIYEALCHSVGKAVPSWSVPKFIFDGIALMSSRIRYKMDKLLGDEYYSSEKLQKLGFRPKRTLRDWNVC
jgi:UDP-glucose 4-epimerase